MAHFRRLSKRHLKSRKIHWGLYFIVILAIFLLIYVLSPTLKNKANNLFQDFGEKIKKFSLSNLEVKCQDNFREDIKMAELKNPNKNYVILDRLSTWNRSESLNFIETWSPEDKEEAKKYILANFVQNPEGLRAASQEEIGIIIFRVDGIICNDACRDYSEVKTSICKAEDARFFTSNSLYDLFGNWVG